MNFLSRNFIIFFLVFFFFLMLQRDYMLFDIVGVEMGYISQELTFTLAFFLMNSIGLYSLRPSVKVRNSFILTIKRLLIFTYVISIFWSLFSPIGLLRYIQFLNPILSLLYLYKLGYSCYNKYIPIFTVLSVIVLMFVFGLNYNTLVIRSVSDDNIVTNSIYSVMYILPLALCSEKKYIRYIILGIVIAGVIVSAKRGGLIAISLGVIFYIISNSLISSKQFNKTRIIFIIIVLICILFYLYGKIQDSNLLIANRLSVLSETGGNGREDIWRETIDMFFNSGPVNMLLGHGYNRVVTDNSLGFSAHNDFLEVAYDYGIIMFVMYCYIHICIVKLFIKYIREKSKYASPLVFSYMLFFTNSMVSHIYIYPQYLLCFTIVWGGIIGLHDNEKYKINKIYENRSRCIEL